VAHLVHDREQALQVAGVVAGRDAHVVRVERLGEGVHGEVQPPGPVLEAHGAGDLERQLLLRPHRKWAGQRRCGAGGADLAHERHEAVAQRAEDVTDDLGGQAGLEGVHEGVVGVGGLGKARRQLAAQAQVLLEEGREARKVGHLAGLEPRALRPHARDLHLSRELPWHPQRPVVVAARDADDRLLTEVVGLRGGQELAERGIRLARVSQPRDGGQKLRPALRSAGGHHRLLVPAQQRGVGAEVRQLLEAAQQLRREHARRIRPEQSGARHP
jgi:hypothetical protein